MKNILTITRSLLCGGLALLLFAGCNDDDDDKLIGYNDLPGNARAFVETYFPEVGVQSVTRDNDGGTEYTVLLQNGTEIDFYGNGEWQSVECRFSTLPAGILPAAIESDIATRYPDAQTRGVERETGGYEVEITQANGVPIKARYTDAGVFIGQEIDR